MSATRDECIHGLTPDTCSLCKHGVSVPMREARCRSCGAAIVWARTDKGRTIPLDAEPADDGNLVVIGSHHGERGTSPLVTYSRTAEVRYVSHFSTCPDAGSWRKR